MKFKFVEEHDSKRIEYKGFIIEQPYRQRVCAILTKDNKWIGCADSIKEAKYFIDTEHSKPDSYTQQL